MSMTKEECARIYEVLRENSVDPDATVSQPGVDKLFDYLAGASEPSAEVADEWFGSSDSAATEASRLTAAFPEGYRMTGDIVLPTSSTSAAILYRAYSEQGRDGRAARVIGYEERPDGTTRFTILGE